MPQDEQKSLRAQARWAAMSELVARHRAEFDQLHGDAREQRGLERETMNPSDLVTLRARVKDLEAELKALRDE